MPVEGRDATWEVELKQTFQMLSGNARGGDSPARIESVRLRGAEVALVVSSTANGREIRQELSGVLSGDTIRGKMRSGSGPDALWEAKRVARGRIDIEH
jgi:hypothetical protein